jgi:valyl-tRNA synthetase
VLLQNAGAVDEERVARHRQALDFLARLESITVLPTGEEAPESALALVDHLEIRVPMAGLIDKEAELARLDKERKRLADELSRTEGKLANDNFLNRAPADVVQRERDKLSEARSALERLNEQRVRIEQL